MSAPSPTKTFTARFSDGHEITLRNTTRVVTHCQRIVWTKGEEAQDFHSWHRTKALAVSQNTRSRAVFWDKETRVGFSEIVSVEQVR